jgi:hypothetical protein
VAGAEEIGFASRFEREIVPTIIEDGGSLLAW